MNGVDSVAAARFTRRLTGRPLVLDEPKAELDNEYQRAVQTAIDSLQNVLILEVAQRLTSARSADAIVVMSHGTGCSARNLYRIGFDCGPAPPYSTR